MNIFWIFNGNKLKRMLVLFVATIFAISVIYTQKNEISVFTQVKDPSAIYNVVTDKKWIALTFDISWGDKEALPIIQTLEDKGVKKATFFISSLWGKDYPDIVKKLVDTDFEIGSHGHKFTNYSQLSDNDIRKQIQASHGILTELTGKAPRLIRLPNGDFDHRVLRIASELQYQVIQWDTDSQDWTQPGVAEIVKRVVTNAHNGDIVLMHASDSARQTAKALPLIIDALRSKGYEFVTVSELLAQTKLEHKEVH